MRELLIVPVTTAILIGCAQYRPMFSRFDGRPLDNVHLEQSNAACKAKAEVETMQVPHKILGDAYGFGRAMEQEHVRKASFQGCMAEKGLRVDWVKDAPETASITPAK